MIILHTRTFDPLSRAMKIALAEKKANFHAIEAPLVSNSQELLAVDKRGRTPILIDDLWGNGAIIPDPVAAFEYIEEIIPAPPLFPSGPLERAKIRTLSADLVTDFSPILQLILEEKIYKFVNRNTSPDTNNLREIRNKIRYYLRMLTVIARGENYLIGDKISLADLIAASQISVLDYFDLIDWSKFDALKHYYQYFKQRPSFTQILNERILFLDPPRHYSVIDF